jgi:hypothetical protein
MDEMLLILRCSSCHRWLRRARDLLADCMRLDAGNKKASAYRQRQLRRRHPAAVGEFDPAAALGESNNTDPSVYLSHDDANPSELGLGPDCFVRDASSRVVVAVE